MKEEPEIPGEETPSSPTAEEGTPSRPPVTGIVKKEYKFPPLSLLHTDHAKGESQSDVAKNASIIESTLKSFGVMARVIHASVGPTVTRFELRPEVGVRVSRIEGLSNELAMALAATHIRIEAPIPGKSAVGIEIPNSRSASVPLRDVLDSSEFKNGKGHILVALGKDITGKPVVTDLSKTPHLLIAGSTGSGKSVCINSIITSIIYHSRPEDVKLMLIDPKVVELSVYNGIPHLRTEVITNMKKAEGALNWAVREMEARYQLFAGARVRNIEGYNKQNPDKKMPYILIIVDEFADLMNVAAKEVEVLIQRLTQKARAAGIHLILATQRPSADVITGVIKSNIPSRIAFMVESALNSRIILDEGGAETLLGKGDMLFKQAGALTTVRIQGAFISDEEVEAVVDYVRKECMEQEKAPVTYEPIDLSVPEKNENTGTEEEEEQDSLLEEAAEWVLDTKRASVSALQRRFRIGYTRAGRLMDSMERLGIVGPAEGAKPRDILMDKLKARDLFEQMKNGGPTETEKAETEKDGAQAGRESAG
ncbi:DNA translocase FtsK [Dialister succinatiphilus]